MDWKKLAWFRKMFFLDKDIKKTQPFKVDTSWSTVNWYNSLMQFDLDRRRIYSDVEEMDTWFAISSSLDMYSEDAFPRDMDSDQMVWVRSKDDKIVSLGSKFLTEILGDKLYAIVRATAKYGTNFEQIIRTDSEIVTTKYVRPDLLTRIEDQYGRLIGFSPGMMEQYMDGQINTKTPEKLSDPWDFVQFRISSRTQREFIHGESMLQAARRLWRQCKIVLDAMVLYRWMRAPDRWVYYIDCTGQSPEQQFETCQNWKRQLMKKERYDPAQNTYASEFNPMAIDEDIFWPTVKDSESRVEKWPSSNNVDDIADIRLLMGMLCASLRIPKAYMGFDENNSPGAWLNKSTLAQQDVRYARTIYRLQRAVMVSLRDMIRIHLVLHGINPNEIGSQFLLHCAPVSFLDETARAELFNLRVDLMSRMMTIGQQANFDMDKWMDYILYKFIKLPRHMIKMMKREKPLAGSMPQDQTQQTIVPPELVNMSSGPMGTVSPVNSPTGIYGSEFSDDDAFELPPKDKAFVDSIVADLYPRFDVVTSGIRQFDGSVSSESSKCESDSNFYVEKLYNRVVSKQLDHSIYSQ